MTQRKKNAGKKETFRLFLFSSFLIGAVAMEGVIQILKFSPAANVKAGVSLDVGRQTGQSLLAGESPASSPNLINHQKGNVKPIKIYYLWIKGRVAQSEDCLNWNFVPGLETYFPVPPHEKLKNETQSPFAPGPEPKDLRPGKGLMDHEDKAQAEGKEL